MSGLRILLVEDEELFARAVAKRLARDGHDCVVAGTLREAMVEMARPKHEPDLMLLDERLPDGRGLDFMRRLLGERENGLPSIVVMTAFADIDHAVTAMKLGAVDYLQKPVDLDDLAQVIARVGRNGKRVGVDAGKADAAVSMIGESAAMQGVRARIDELAEIDSGDAAAPTVLILGETGTGKDLAARLMHARGPRAKQPFMHVDCAALPRELIEAELFGHEKGAFTGARGERRGLIEAAGAGVVFLDEIGELSLELQAKLLSVLDRRKVRRIGSNSETGVEARFFAATNRDLSAMVAEGGFRADLYFRLNVLTLEMLPLRDLREDVPALTQFFARQAATAFGRATPRFARDAMTRLSTHEWPGNLRELKHTVEKAVLLNKGAPVSARDIDLVASPPSNTDLRQDNGVLGELSLEDAEKHLILRALRRAGGNVSEAARLLDTTRMTLRYRMEKHEIDASEIKLGQ